MTLLLKLDRNTSNTEFRLQYGILHINMRLALIVTGFIVNILLLTPHQH
jgi:hypothetical protein